MRLLGSANPETLDTWKAHYRQSVLALLLVVWLISPSPNRAVEPTSTESGISSSISSTLSDGVQQLPSPDSITLAAASASPRAELPLTPAYSQGSAPSSGSNESTDTTTMPVKGSTTRDSNSSSSWSATPPISQPPPPPKRSAEAGVQSEGSREVVIELFEVNDDGDTVEDSSAEGSTSPPGPYSDSELADAFEEFTLFLLSSLHHLVISLLSWRPYSLHIFALALHILAAVQLVILLAEDSIIRTSMADPMPRDLPRGSTLGKRVSRWNWRMGQLWQRFGGAMSALLGCSLVLGWMAWDMAQNGEEAEWNDVPGARWLSEGMMLREDPVVGGVSSPLRMLVGVQTLLCVLSLVQPVKHLLPNSVLPPTLPPPAFLLAHSPTSVTSPPPLALESSYLITVVYNLAYSFITLFKLTLLLFSILPTSRSAILTFLFKPAPHLLFHSISAKLRDIRKTRDGFRRAVECLRVVAEIFPERAGMKEEAGASEWVCTICFEGVEDGAGSSTPQESSPRSSTALRTTEARCRLPCDHRFHAGCLSTWLQYQAWCPTCHRKIQAPTPQPPIEEDTSDLYPGARAAERRRATALLAGAQ